MQFSWHVIYHFWLIHARAVMMDDVMMMSQLKIQYGFSVD
jgi:hypothetical protein